MKYKLSELFAYRFYEKKDGPFVTLVQFDTNKIHKIGCAAGITNIDEIYVNRKRIEDLMYRLFVRQGGKPLLNYPYYAAVYEELPKTNQLHVRFEEPECIKIPMNAFSKDEVSFTYCQSPRAFTRKDNHPTRRKLLMWDEAEEVINRYSFSEIEDTWIEMQIWNDRVLKYYYENCKKDCVSTFQVIERLSKEDIQNLVQKYNPYKDLIKPEFFVAPFSAHGLNHAMRVLILTQELSDLYGIDNYLKNILLYCAVFHDIGRENQEVDAMHGYKSFQKVLDMQLVPDWFDEYTLIIFKYIVENHPIDIEQAKSELKIFLPKDRENVFFALKIFKDADTLDRCRFGFVNRYYLCTEKSQGLIHFAYQLLRIYRESIV